MNTAQTRHHRTGTTLLATAALLGTALLASVAGCRNDAQNRQTADGVPVLTVWAHSGREPERNALEQMAEAFNRANPDVKVELTFLPEGTYNSQVQSAALAGDLPDVLEFDGPFVYSYVWQGHLRPIGDLLSKETMDNLIDSIIEQGMYRGKFYAVGMFDSGLALFARKSKLDEINARIPTGPNEAWTIDEFDTILAKLAENDDDGQVLDLKLNYTGEWFTYGFSPAIQSAGGDLIDRNDYQSADGVLNGPEAVSVMKRFQRWVDEDKYVDANVDDNAFVGGRVALSWVGHWEYDRYQETFGEDLILVPLPDFGEGSKTGQGSWNWGITQNCRHPEKAAKFIDFLLEDDNVIAMTRADGAVPATKSAIQKRDLYKKGGELHLYVELLEGDYSVPRPRTPAYPVITSVFQQAFDDIINGADVQEALDMAVKAINQDIEDNHGYAPRGENDG
jgi:multiple sugar transport system substrate-binding protein